MTLIELLISVLILVLIVGPMTMVLQFALSTANVGSHRTTDSAGAQLLSSYLIADVQTSDFVWTSDHKTPFSTAPFTTQCGTGDTRLELQWVDALSSTVSAVTYDVLPAGVGEGAETAFARRTWSLAGGCSQTDSTNLVAALDPAQLPTVVCAPVSCAKPTTVQLTVNARSENVHNSSLYTNFTFNLTASRRAA